MQVLLIMTKVIHNTLVGKLIENGVEDVFSEHYKTHIHVILWEEYLEGDASERFDDICDCDSIVFVMPREGELDADMKFALLVGIKLNKPIRACMVGGEHGEDLVIYDTKPLLKGGGETIIEV